MDVLKYQNRFTVANVCRPGTTSLRVQRTLSFVRRTSSRTAYDLVVATAADEAALAGKRPNLGGGAGPTISAERQLREN